MATKNEKSLTPAQKGRITRLSQKNPRELATKVVFLTDELALTQTRLHNAKCACNVYRDNLNAKDADFDKLKADSDALKKKIEELKRHSKIAEMDISNFTSEVESLNNTIKTLNDRIDNYKNIIHSNNLSFKSYKEEIEKYKGKLKDLTSSLLKVSEQNETSNNQIDALTKDIRGYVIKYRYLESKYNNAKNASIAAGIIILIGILTMIFL